MIDFATAPAPDPARGIFETALVLDGVPRAWSRHRARLGASALALYGADPGPAVDAAVAAAAAGTALGRLRVDVVPGPAGFATAARCEPLGEDVVLAQPEPEIELVRVRRGFGAHKLIDRAWLEEIEAAVAPGARALLVGTEGELLETTRANVFVVRDGALETPPLDGRILPGVTRAIVLECARAARIPVREGRVTLEGADAIVLTGSVRLLECRRLADGARSDAAIEALRVALGPAEGQ